jgi:hypothetical protein
MNQYLAEFYGNWNAKLQSIVGDELAKVYDRYITAFVIYNNLYNVVPEMLIRQGVPLPAKLFDNKMATDMVVQYLGAQRIMDLLQQHNQLENIDEIISLIDQEVFHIKIHLGQHQRNEDLKLLADLSSNNIVKKSTAILKVMYYVRCNVFHGHKNFEEYQRLLVEPLFQIIEVINAELYATLQA